MGKTAIEWTEHSWNPVTGCSPVSEGCRNCYARKMARRLAGRYGYPKEPHEFDVTLHPDRLDVPLKRRKPTTYFVCSMGDLFHEDIPFSFSGKVFATMIAADWHIFQIFTKRPERIPSFVSWFQEKTALSLRPFRHIWLGISVEDQETADERVPLLLQIPAAVRFVSYEPALGPVNLSDCLSSSSLLTTVKHLQWVICGGESGPGARPMHPDWAREVRDQCQAAGVPFFFKQWGAWFPRSQWADNPHLVLPDDCDCVDGDNLKIIDNDILHCVGKKRAGRLLDGRTWDQMPKREEER